MSSFCPILAILCTAALTVAQAPVTIATHYFYWYHWPTEHFNEPGAPGREGHCQHFVDADKVSYLSVDWHAQQFAAMASCGIDAALPVYWGAPGAYERPNLAFSRRGLGPMVQAIERLLAAGQKVPKLGLFYDTSTLANDTRGVAPKGGRPDLTTSEGRALFCMTVTDYFAAIPEPLWARQRDGALVVLYVSAFAGRWDNTLGQSLRDAFAARFPGEKVCLVADASWGDIGQDLTTSWGAALTGAHLHEHVAQIGPGYDDRAVPGRLTPVREREGGAFYARSWQLAIARRPELVLLETWNEMHEGTGLCTSRELGNQYLDLTRQWGDTLRSGAAIGDPIVLQYPEARPQPDLGWGAEAKGAVEVYWDQSVEPGKLLGMRPVAVADGPIDPGVGQLRPGRVSDGGVSDGSGPDGGGGYLYLQVSDHFAFDVDADYELVIVRDGAHALYVEFDSHDPKGVFDGSYTTCKAAVQQKQGRWLRESYLLRNARFCNRQNGGADFRFVLPDRQGEVQSLHLRKVGG
jgi:hypothetical protein